MTLAQTAVAMLADIAEHGSDLNQLSPSEFSKAIAETLPVLAAEFSNISLTISRENVPQFCEDFRRGMFERTVEEGTRKGIPETELRAKIDISAFSLPNRIERLSRMHPYVGFELTPGEARLLALDIGCGILCRTH